MKYLLHKYTSFFLVIVLLLILTPVASAVTQMKMQSGYYMGTGSAQTITGLGLNPELVIIKSDTISGAMVFKTSAMPAPNTASVIAAADSVTSDVILAIEGFTVGSLASVNSPNVRYTYQAFSGSNCSANGQFCVGLYIGDGALTRKITTGFQPDSVWVKRSGTSANWRSSAMPSDHGQFFDGTVGSTTGVLYSTLDTDGFNVGLTNNGNLGVYYYIAFKSTAGVVSSGSYTGNGLDDRDIVTPSINPEYVIVKNANTVGPAALNTRESYGDYSGLATASVNTINNIQGLSTESFQVGSSANVNANGNTFYWMAFAGSSPRSSSGTFNMRSGSYTGTGVGLSVTGLPFKPDLVIVKHNDQVVDQHAVFKTALMSGNASAYFSNPVANLTTGITTLNSDGFTVGNNAVVNTSGDTYYWTAFGNAFDPVDSSGASDFAIGAYTGNGLDDRNITRNGNTPSMITIKSSAAALGTWRSSANSGDFSNLFSANASASNYIQGFSSDGFSVGTNTSVNTTGALYYWFSFSEGSQFAVGNYTGSAVARSVSSVIEPGLMWVKEVTGISPAIMRSSKQLGDAASPFTNLPTRANAITAINSTGYTIGTDASVNNNSIVYTTAVWKAADETAPTTSIIYSDTDAIVKQGDSLVITATFTEPISAATPVTLSISGTQTVLSGSMSRVTDTVYTYTHIVGTGNGIATVAMGTGTDLSGNTITAIPTAGANFTVDNTAPADQDIVLNTSNTVTAGQVVTVSASSSNTDVLWVAPSGTTNFSGGATMTSANSTPAMGVFTISINAPSTPGVYHLYVVDVVGNYSIASLQTITVTAPVVVSSGGGGGGGGGSAYITPVVAVIQPVQLATAIQSTQPAVLVEPVQCPYFAPARIGSRGENVKRIQTFLNKELKGKKLKVTGRFGLATKLAVNKYQVKYFDEILKPWKFKKPTGRVARTTLIKMHETIGCDESDFVASNQ